MTRIPEAVRRLKGLYLEVPGSQLSSVEAARLSGLDPEVCESVLAAFEDARILRRSRTGIFSLVDGSPVVVRRVMAARSPEPA